MQVVDAVEVHVLRVPSKCGLPHAKIEVGGVDTFDHDATLLLHHIQQGVEVTDVPLLDTLEKFFYCYIYLEYINQYLGLCKTQPMWF